MKINVLRIEKELALQGLTKKRLAELAGMHRQNLTTVLNRGSCEAITAGKISKALGVDIVELMQPEREADHETG